MAKQQLSQALYQLQITEKELHGTRVELDGVKEELKITKEEYNQRRDEHKQEVMAMRWQEMIALVVVGCGKTICKEVTRWFRRCSGAKLEHSEIAMGTPSTTQNSPPDPNGKDVPELAPPAPPIESLSTQQSPTVATAPKSRQEDNVANPCLGRDTPSLFAPPLPLTTDKTMTGSAWITRSEGYTVVKLQPTIITTHSPQAGNDASLHLSADRSPPFNGHSLPPRPQLSTADQFPSVVEVPLAQRAPLKATEVSAPPASDEPFSQDRNAEDRYQQQSDLAREREETDPPASVGPIARVRNAEAAKHGQSVQADETNVSTPPASAEVSVQERNVESGNSQSSPESYQRGPVDCVVEHEGEVPPASVESSTWVRNAEETSLRQPVVHQETKVLSPPASDELSTRGRNAEDTNRQQMSLVQKTASLTPPASGASKRNAEDKALHSQAVSKTKTSTPPASDENNRNAEDNTSQFPDRYLNREGETSPASVESSTWVRNAEKTSLYQPVPSDEPRLPVPPVSDVTPSGNRDAEETDSNGSHEPKQRKGGRRGSKSDGPLAKEGKRRRNEEWQAKRKQKGRAVDTETFLTDPALPPAVSPISFTHGPSSASGHTVSPSVASSHGTPLRNGSTIALASQQVLPPTKNDQANGHADFNISGSSPRGRSGHGAVNQAHRKEKKVAKKPERNGKQADTTATIDNEALKQKQAEEATKLSDADEEDQIVETGVIETTEDATEAHFTSPDAFGLSLEPSLSPATGPANNAQAASRPVAVANHSMTGRGLETSKFSKPTSSIQEPQKKNQGSMRRNKNPRSIDR
ncbi:hypothetical protein QFC20_004773 [Naganishia adeliensis]|uniref:Uncharacterized protein n=1 Tax=Naganishia adeliensis TaxID=92952 RepID=A0ACC2VXL4_9TREE|nr:hypothetical protein QFC20_004773 [Naganishia adeliensis]